MRESILIAGGSGLLGSRLIELVDPSKYEIHILSRSKHKDQANLHFHLWDIEQMTIDSEALRVDHIINIAGAGIADKRWSANRKAEIIESRKKSAELIFQGLSELNHRPKTYISASAIGFYGNCADQWLNEKSENGKDFLAECCKIWEESAHKLNPLVDRLLINRIGIVLSSKGGALPKMLLTKKFRVYSYFGDGSQFYSWIHIDDLCSIFLHQLENPITGIYNAVGPNPMTNKIFIQKLKKAFNGFASLSTPKFIMNILLGEMSAIVLNSNRVSSCKIEDAGFKFRFPDLNTAVLDLTK